MKNGLVIADSGPIFSLALIDKLDILLDINCIGLIGLLSIAKDKGLIENLRPIFDTFLQNKRFYSVDLLNAMLMAKGEEILSYKV